jgi:hypothetical protein
MVTGRRAALLILIGLSRCGSGEPDQNEALAMIAARIKASYGPGEKMLSNLTFRKGAVLADGSYAMFVDYDLISTVPEIGLFNTATRAGERTPVLSERYIFVRSGGDWVLQ